jgi:hypothetical protein
MQVMQVIICDVHVSQNLEHHRVLGALHQSPPEASRICDCLAQSTYQCRTSNCSNSVPWEASKQLVVASGCPVVKVTVPLYLLPTDPAEHNAAHPAADLVALTSILLDDCVLTLGALSGPLHRQG